MSKDESDDAIMNEGSEVNELAPGDTNQQAESFIPKNKAESIIGNPDQFVERPKIRLTELDELKKQVQTYQQQLELEYKTKDDSVNFDELQPDKNQQIKIQPVKKVTMTIKEEIALAFKLFQNDKVIERSNAQQEMNEIKKQKAKKPEQKSAKQESNQPQSVEEQILQGPKSTRFHMPKPPQNDKSSIDYFKTEMVNLLCSFEPHGSISDAVINRFKLQEDVGTPPTIQDIIADISENTSYKQEKMRFMKAQGKNNSHFSLNVSASFSAMAKDSMKNFSLMNDMGDIMLQYGKHTGFKTLIPIECVQSRSAELNNLFEKTLPRCAFGCTISCSQMHALIKDCHLHHIFKPREVDALFYRACFVQNKYIINYVDMNPVARPQQVKKVKVVNFDFLECSNEEMYANKPDFQLLSGSGVHYLCYIGFLQFMYILAVEIIRKSRPEHLHEIPALAHNDDYNGEEEEENDEPDNMEQNYEMAKKNQSNKRISASIRDPFAIITQMSKVDDKPRAVQNQTFSGAWKTAYAFGLLLDCYVLRFAKRYGINLRNQMMESFLSKDALQLTMRYQTELKTIFSKQCNGAQKLTADQLHMLFKKTQILDKISKNFLLEYVTRNYTNYDLNFVPCLNFDEFLNCLWVASNCAFSVHPYIIHLKTPVQRYQYALENAIQSIK